MLIFIFSEGKKKKKSLSRWTLVVWQLDLAVREIRAILQLNRCRHHQPHCRGLTSLPQNKSWHHRWADTAPLARLDRRCAGPSLHRRGHVGSGILSICIQRAREDPPLLVLCRKTLHLSPLLFCCVDADGSTNNPPSPTSLPPSPPHSPETVHSV